MILKDLLTRLALECELEPCTVAQYARALEKWALFLGREAGIEDLNPNSVNTFLVSLSEKGLTGTTVRNYRAGLLRVWNFAVRENLTQPYDRSRIRSPKIIRRPVRAWTLSQVQMLVSASKLLPGRLRDSKIPRSVFAPAYVRFAYDTGMRPEDQRRVRWLDLDWDAMRVYFVQHKTGQPHSAPVSEASKVLLSQMMEPRRELIFPLGEGGMRRLELQLFEIADSLGFNRLRGQGLGTLRKTHATQIYEAEGEHAAAESLGHVGGVRTVRQSYIDSRSIKTGRLPPDLAG
jgi:integrase